jgi:hypothetical protein
MTGLGTQASPYIISTLDDLNMVRNNLSAYYILANDIDASATSTWNSGAGWVPIGNSTSKFTGNFNGRGYNISGICINRPSENNLGFFGYISAAGIQNLSLSNIQITGNMTIGAMYGYGISENVKRCCAINVNIVAQQEAGGFCGSTYGTNDLSNNYVTGNITCPSYCGQFIGGMYYDGFIMNCYAVMNKNSSVMERNFTARFSMAGGVTDCYYYANTGDTQVVPFGTPCTDVQLKAKANYISWNFSTVWTIDSGINYGYPQLNTFLLRPAIGLGIQSNPYKISTINELRYIHCELLSYYELANDIDASDTINWNDGAGWMPIGNNTSKFTGSFDGKGFKIKNLYSNRPLTNYVGLFGWIDVTTNSDVKNIGLVNANIRGKDNVGALSGYTICVSSSTKYIDKCYSTGVIVGAQYVGGLLGLIVQQTADIILSNCYSSCSVSGTDFVGGLFGRANGQMAG